MERVEDFAGYASTSAPDFTDEQARLVEAVRSGGEHVTYGHRPFVEGAYVAVDGTFYRAQVERTGSERMTRWVLGADVGEDAEAPVAVDGLPETDVTPVVSACRRAIAREQDDDRDRTSGEYVYVFRTIAEDETALLPRPEPGAVEYASRTFRLWTEERDVHEDEYTTTLEVVASDPDEFERRVEDEFVVDLDEHELDPGQRDVIETAIEEGEYSEDGEAPREFGELIDLLRDRAPGPRSLVKYDGEYYTWTSFHSD